MRESMTCWLSAACMLATLAIAPSSAGAADNDSRPDSDAKRERAAALSSQHHEVPRDAYIPSPREEHPRSPAVRFSSGTFFSVQVNVDANGQNIVGDAANEPSLAVDPADPNNMVIGWRQFNTIASDFRQAGYGYTTDGGQTWTFPGVLEPGVFRSDPVLDSDANGDIYYNSLTLQGDDFLCDVFRSSAGGASWDSGTPAQGGDKQWMTIDKTGSVGAGHIYAAWNSFFTSCPPGFFTRSIDGSEYEDCITIPDEPFWGTLAVGPGGALYVVGTDGNEFVVAKSSNAKFAGQSVTWDFSAPISLGGTVNSNTGPNPGGLLGQTWIAADPTPPGPGGGGAKVYVLCSVDPPGGDPLDVRFSRSTDGGHTWSASVRVNDDVSTSAWQWFSTMSVSPSGRIDAIWLDTRDNPGTFLSSLYYSFSTDSGVTWSANERLSNSFNPHVGWPQQNKMGDYFHMISDDEGFRLAWAGTFNGEQDVYYGRRTQPSVAVGEGLQVAPVAFLQSDPNPFESRTSIRYGIPHDAFVSLIVYDAQGRKVTTLVERDQPAGTYETRFDARGLASGVYFYRLTADELQKTEKALLLK